MNKSLRFLGRLSILLGSIATISQAATVVWEPDGVAGGATGGAGAWNQSGAFWNGNGVLAPWNNAAGNTALFGGTAGTVTLAEPITAGGLQFNVTGYTLAGGGNALTLANNAIIAGTFAANGSATINAPLAGTNLVFNPLLADSLANLNQGRIILAASPTNTGTTTISNGVLELANGVTMTTGTGITVNGSGLYHPNALTGLGTDYPYHRLRQGMLVLNGNSDFFGSQMVTLNGGTILRTSQAGGNDTGTIQNLTLNSGESILASAPSGANAGDTLAITNLTRAATATVQFRSAYGPLGANGDNGKIAITNINGSAIANTNGILGGWAYANENAGAAQGNGFATAFAAWDATTQSVKAATPDKASGAAGATLLNQTLASALPTDNWLANGNNGSNTITSSLTINSLIEQSDVIVNNGATLTVASGGIIFRTQNFWMQSGDSTGQLTSGEASGKLYINAANTNDAFGDMRVRLRVVDNGATPVQLIKAGNSGIRLGTWNSNLSTGNTYSGGTVIQAGRIIADAVDAFGSGKVSILPGGQAYLVTAGNYTNPFDVAGYGAPETAGTLGAIRFGGGTTAGLITLTGDARINANASTGNITGGIAETGGPRNVEFGGSVGAGTINLSGTATTYTGATLISNNRVNVGTTATPATSDLLASTSSLTLGNTLGAGSINYIIGGNINYTKNVTFGTAGTASAFYVNSTTTANTFTITNSTIGTNVANGDFGVTGGTITLGAGANVTANRIITNSTPANSATAAVGTMNVLPGATITTQYLDLGEGSNTAGIMNQSGGTVTVLSGLTGVRVGHWTNGLTPASQYNLSSGTLDATAIAANAAVEDRQFNIGWDGAGAVTVGGGADTAMLKTSGIRLDRERAGAGNVNTLTIHTKGVVEVGTLGINAAGTNDLVVLNGGILRATADSTWKANTQVNAGNSMIDTNGKNVTLSGALASSGVLSKFGAGTLLITNATSGGLTSVDIGTLAGVGNFGMLTVIPGARIMPGASFADGAIGTMFTDKVDFFGNARMDLNGSDTTAGGGINDLVTATGSVTFYGGSITPVFNSTPANGNVYKLFTANRFSSHDGFPQIDPSVPASRLTYTLGTNAAETDLTLTVSGTTLGLKWTGGSNSTWDNNVSQNWQFATPNDEKFMAYDSVTFDAAGATSPNVTAVGTIYTGGIAVGGTTNYSFTGNGTIGSGTLTKTGSGKLTIAVANQSTGATSVNEGTLQIGNGGTAGSLGAGAVALSNGTTLIFDRSDNTTVANAISGAGSVIKNGAGTLTLPTVNSFSGGLVVNSGVLELTARQTASGDTSVNGGILRLNAPNTPASTIGTGNLTINGPGVVESGVNGFGYTDVATNITINGGILRQIAADSHLGRITLNGGTVTGTDGAKIFAFHRDIAVQASANPSVISVAIVNLLPLAGGANANAVTFDVSDGTAATDLQVTAQLRDVGGIFKAGPGLMLLDGVNTFTGGITVGAGTLAVDSTGGSGRLRNNAGVSVLNSGTFEIRGVNALAAGVNAIDVTVAAGGTLRVMSGGSAGIGAGGTSHAHIRDLTLNGGAIDLRYSGTGAAYNNESFQLNGNVTTGGTAMSTIGFSGGATLANQGIALAGNRTFTVGEAVAGTDLKITAQLENTDTTPADDGVIKAGLGTLEIAGVSDYSGPTIVNEGAFVVSGSLTGTSSVSVASAGTLGGSGTIAPSGTGTILLSAGASFAPGVDGIGKLTVDGGTSTAVNLLSFLPDAVLKFELGSGQTSDSVALINGAAGDIYFGGNLLTLSGSVNSGTYTLFSANVPNAYEGLVLDGSGTILGGLVLDPAFTSLNPDANLKVVGNDILLTVPEPASALTLLGGLGVLASLRSRRRRV